MSNQQDGLDIGVDIDGVMYDFGASLKMYMALEGYSVFDFPDPTSWTFYRNWGLSDEHFREVTSRGVDEHCIFMDGDPTPGTKEALERLRADGHRIHLITDRSAFGSPGEAQYNTAKWLATHHIPYDSLTFSADKTVVKTDLMIDDKLENYYALDATGCMPYLYDQPWNRDTGDEDPRRVSSLEAFVDCVETYSEALQEALDDQAAEEVAQTLGQSDAGAASLNIKPESILQEADRLVSTDRGKDYGHPFDDFSRTAKMWSGIFGIDVRPEQVPLAMICVKISRETNKPKTDNLVDIAGYAKTLDMVNQRRREMSAELESQFEEIVLADHSTDLRYFERAE